MTTTADLDVTHQAPHVGRSVRFHGREIPVRGPSIRDPRIHLAITIHSIIVIGMVWLDFRLSIPQIAFALLTCGLIELTAVFRDTGMLIWPASALQTATSTALLLRVTGMEPHDWWAFDGWYYFVLIAGGGLMTKYLIRYQGRHVFNPANVALVVAFVVLGAERIEPLDFWWAPFGWPMALAYVIIFVGGITLCRRVGMIEMGIAFFVTFAIGVGVLAALGQSITTRWSLIPISGLHFWWIVVTSPETLIFLYFMITDPKTTPTGRTARIVFGTVVGIMSTILLAPWHTEYGTKVGLLSGLVVATAVRPFIHRWWEVRSTVPYQTGSGEFTSPVSATRRPRWVVASAAVAGAVLFVPAVALAGAPNRNATQPEPEPASVAIDLDPASLPTVSIDSSVAGLSAELATPAGAQALAETLAFNLQVEAEAIRQSDPALLTAVDHGQRLLDMQTTVTASPGGNRVVPTYRFDTLHLSIVYPGGFQSGANAGLTATGTVTTTTYTATGERVGVTDEPFEVLFALRKFESGRWLTTATPPLALAAESER